MAVRTANRMIDVPPRYSSAYPIRPMTSTVPARPITNAPHQFVSLERPEVCTSMPLASNSLT